MRALLLNGWTFMRALRIVLGVIALFAGFQKGDALIGSIGSVVLLQGLLNMSCNGSCSIPVRPSVQKETNTNLIDTKN